MACRHVESTAGPAWIFTDIPDFGALAEFDAWIAAERIGKPGIELQPPDAESGLIAAMFRERDGDQGLVGKPELHAVEWGRALGGDDGVEPQLPERRPAARHQAFAAWLITREGLLLQHDDPTAPARGKECGGGPSWSRSDHRHVGIDPRPARHGHNDNERMCRSIKTLRRKESKPTEQEIHDAALQFVRKISGYRAPSRANAPAFEAAVKEVSASSRRLLNGLAA